MTKNIGNWSAEVDNSGKTPVLKVSGTFPTNGEKPRFELLKNDPQGTVESDLLLTLTFGNLVDPAGSGSAHVHHRETLVTSEDYLTVTVVTREGNTIANIDVK